MGYVHSREEILDAALGLVQDHGLTGATYRGVGQRLGIADRTVVYYFPTKKELLAAILEVVAGKVRAAMVHKLDDGPLTPDSAVTGIWTSLATPAMDPVFRVYIELFGLAAARKTPYVELLDQLSEQWISWLAQRLDLPAEQRQAAAAAAFAQADGLLLLRHLHSHDVANRAASFLGHPRGA